jgi:uncharacterized membrane protein YkoI
MFQTTRRTLLGLALAWPAALITTVAWADRDHDHDQARRAVERGEALPLVDILARVRSQLGGEIVGTSFERKRGRWVYEFKVIGSGGRLTEIYVDAASAEILNREQH